MTGRDQTEGTAPSALERDDRPESA